MKAPEVLPQTVYVPVPTPCIKRAEIPIRPATLAESTWARDATAFERVQALLVDRLSLLKHADKLEAVLIACSE